MKDEATFRELKQMTCVPNGSLHRALNKLKEQGLITVNAKLVNDKPIKVFKLTEGGKELANSLKGLLEFLESEERDG
jgi:DNA-binding PadR family transcriptional regulator